jgi:hypothetical protein
VVLAVVLVVVFVMLVAVFVVVVRAPKNFKYLYLYLYFFGHVLSALYSIDFYSQKRQPACLTAITNCFGKNIDNF